MNGVYPHGLIVAVLCGWLMLAQTVAAEETTTVTIQGEALILQGDMPQARQRALQEAFSAAITHVMGSYISAESFTRNFESIERSVFTRTRGYVREHQVLDETVDEDLLELTVQVTVSEKAVLDDLAALGVVLDAVGNPVVRVEGHDEGLGPPGPSVRMFEELLTARGFLVLDQASSKPADVVVRMAGQLRSRSHMSGMFGAVTALTASAYWIDGGRLITSSSTSANGAAPVEQDAVKVAYQRAAEALFPEFLEALLGQWQNEINNGRPVEISVSNVSYQQLASFESRLSRLFGVGGTTIKRFSDNQGEIVVNFSGTPDLLARLIGMTDFATFHVEVIGFDNAGISLAASRKRS